MTGTPHSHQEPKPISLEEAIRLVHESVRGTSAKDVLDQLVHALAASLNADVAFVGELPPDGGHVITTVAQVEDGKPADSITYPLAGTPCEAVIASGPHVFPRDVQARFPDDHLLVDMNIQAYAGTPLRNGEGKIFGNLVALFRHPLNNVEPIEHLLWVFTTRAASELERMHLEEALYRARDHYRRFFEQDITGDYVSTPEGRLVDANSVFLRIFGFESLEEALSFDMNRLSVSTGARNAFLDRLRRDKMIRDLELDARKKDGTPIRIRENVIGDFNRDGKLVFIRGYIMDITEETRAVRELEESRLQYQRLFEHAPDGIVLVDIETGRLIEVNPAFEKLTGRPRNELIGMHQTQLHPAEAEETARQQFRQHVEQAQQEGTTSLLRQTAVRPDGTRIPVEIKADRVEVDGRVMLQAVFRDITERIQSETALRESEEKFRTLAECMPVGVMIHDEKGFVYANPAALAICQYSKEELAAMPFWDIVHPDHRELVRKRGLARLRGKSPQNRYEFKIIRKDGAVRWIDFTGNRIQFGGKPAGIIVVQDITERKQVEADLRTLNQAVRQAPVGILITDTEGTITFVNEGFEIMTGHSREELLGRHYRALQSDHDSDNLYRQIRDTIDSDATWEGELCNRRKDGSLYWTQAIISPVTDPSGTTINYVSVQLDTTDRKQLEQERNEMETALQQAQKLDTVGTLAGGIAHDFNNILTPILGYAQLAQAQLPADSRARKQVARIEQAAARAKDLVQQILTFSRRVEPSREPLQLAPLVKEALKLLRASIPASIEFETDIHADTGMVLADPTQLHQVLLNLCTNAFHAMEASGGTLTITLGERKLTPEERLQTGLPEGTYAVLSVRDTGTGMSPEVQERMFEPFFTTKPSGKGTGMGLSVVHGIVKSHGGGILVDSTVGEGTTITVLLPTAPVPEVHADGEKQPDKPSAGQGRILVVDDEEMVREMHREGLSALGYTVETVANGLEALSRFRTEPAGFDLVLTDLTMPKMSGFDLAVQLHRIRPDLPIVMITGYNEQLTGDMARISGIREVLTKPCRIEELHAAVCRALRSG